MNFSDIIILFMLIVGVLGAGLYFLNKWASKKMNTQQDFVERSKQSMSIFVIDKNIMKAQDSNLPKTVIEQLPRFYKLRKVPLVKVKVGPQILTLMCDKKVYNALPLKKTVKVEVAGIYIITMKGMKTPAELKAHKKSKSENKSTLQKLKLKK
jgi:hypothetical protein